MKKFSLILLFLISVFMIGCGSAFNEGCEQRQGIRIDFEGITGDYIYYSKGQYSTEVDSSESPLSFVFQDGAFGGYYYHLYNVKDGQFVKITTFYIGNCEDDRYVDEIALYGPIIDTLITTDNHGNLMAVEE